MAQKFVAEAIVDETQDRLFEEALSQAGGCTMAALKDRHANALLEISIENGTLERIWSKLS